MRSCIVGPTAAGKSAIAMALAQRFDLAIVSADSRQVYRGFDIGTAKPTAREQADVLHYGIDVADPTERYSAHRWAEDAKQWEQNARAVQRAPVIVGGTGLYIRALVEPLDPMPSLDPVQRALLEPWLAALSMEELERWCHRLDPARAHLGRTQRLRAIETALLTGERLSEYLGSGKTEPDTEPTRYLVVDPGPILASRIAERVHTMLHAGFEDEVVALSKSIPTDAPAWKASGYSVLRDTVEGRVARAVAIERIIIETRQYAKRQRTWFRHQLPDDAVTHLNPMSPNAVDAAVAWWLAGSDVAGEARGGVHT
ncbi:MAG: tRNA (adenosine(37)-N6)-dimethylallyltransferase MiaA [Gemmatimonadaceae bacterium]|nr:tRNA (adenosine(37)-N6)-dimethylallyltransferase MiaA [Gemmatimonadaceae bacterium]